MPTCGAATSAGWPKAVSKGALGLVAATDVRPRCACLQVDGVSLIGNDRVKDIADWPLACRRWQLPENEVWEQAPDVGARGGR